MKKGFSIAIDGPVASGKGTISKLLAQKLNGIYLDTGAMYRCVALYFLENKINWENIEEVESALKSINIEIAMDKILLNNTDVSSKIRVNAIDKLSSPVAGIQLVRDFLIQRQKEIARELLERGDLLIAEGRDVATHVIPNADLKIYLTAKAEIRSARRFVQYQELGIVKSLEQVEKDTVARDNQDMNINHTLVNNPKDFGYLVIDDSDLSKDQTLEIILASVREIRND